LRQYPTSVTGSIHGMLENNGIFRVYESSEPLGKDKLFALFSIHMKGKTCQIVLLDAGTPISSSYEYDEQKVLANTILQSDTIAMRFKPAYTYMEQIVTMTKKLHLTIYSGANGKWLFTKIHIKDALDPSLYLNKVLTVKAEKNFQNKLTQCSITLDDQPTGSIFFSLMLQTDGQYDRNL
jgi:hypothetical protein